jgi:hypothetical protein
MAGLPNNRRREAAAEVRAPNNEADEPGPERLLQLHDCTPIFTQPRLRGDLAFSGRPDKEYAADKHAGVLDVFCS